MDASTLGYIWVAIVVSIHLALGGLLFWAVSNLIETSFSSTPRRHPLPRNRAKPPINKQQEKSIW